MCVYPPSSGRCEYVKTNADIMSIRITFCSRPSVEVITITYGCEKQRSHAQVRMVHTGLQHAVRPRGVGVQPASPTGVKS